MTKRLLPAERVAVFSDIHGNYPAFQACYENALRHGAQGFVFLGDYISDLAEPIKTLDLVYEIQSKYPTVCLRGNRERYMLDCAQGRAEFRRGSKMGSLLYTFEMLRQRDLDFIQRLPIYDVIQIGGVPFEIAHAIKDDDRYYFDTRDGNLEKVFSQMKQPFLLTGHAHKQYIYSNGDRTVINPGSVGVPRGCGNWTMYALLDVRDGKVRCNMRQLPYDIKQTIHAQFARGLVDYAKCWAIGILYDVITGEECALTLLQRVLKYAGENPDAVYDEELWHRLAQEMDMKFTEREILANLNSDMA